MRRHQVLHVLLVLFLMAAMAHAQQRTANPLDTRARVRVQGGAVVQLDGNAIERVGALFAPAGAWWTNPAMVARLGITDDQKAKIERAFDNHKQRLASSTELLEKEEAQLARLLEAESIDRNAVHTQIDRVAQARTEMERTNAAMTLEMREQLTRAQWMQLQAQPTWLHRIRYVDQPQRENGFPIGQPAPATAPPAPGAREGSAGASGGRRGGPPRQ